MPGGGLLPRPASGELTTVGFRYSAVVIPGGAVLRPLVGGERIARAYAEIARPAGDRTTFVECTVNGLPGPVAYQDGTVATVFAFEIAGD